MHEHKACNHKFSYCAKCDVVYCAKCHKEWGGHGYWIYPSQPYIYPNVTWETTTYGGPPVNTGSVTAYGCKHD